MHSDEVGAALETAAGAIAAAGDLDALKRVRAGPRRRPLARCALANREIGALPPAAAADAGKRVGRARAARQAALDARQAGSRPSATRGCSSRRPSTSRCPWDRRAARRPAPADHACRSGSPTSSSRWATRWPRVPRSRPSGSTSTRSTSPPDHPARDRCRTRSASRRPTPGWCCAPTPRRCRSARCWSATPPLYVVCPGRSTAPTSSTRRTRPVFHQVEGLAVDEGITMAHLRGTLDHFADAMFGDGLRPGSGRATSRSPSRQRRARPGVLRVPRRLGRRPGAGRAAPASPRAGSSGAAAAWSTRGCWSPAASTRSATAASRSAWASSGR